ncbi:MAG: sigma-70 family RNA polymerase sigma factor [Anaerolineae bacterium]|nr:sigma-70 family RNA polymerase sigma factor [Anaerolineae bacterium]
MVDRNETQDADTRGSSHSNMSDAAIDILEHLDLDVSDFEPEGDLDEDWDAELESLEEKDLSLDTDLADGSDDTLAMYLSRIGQVALLSREQEVDLAKQIEQGDRAKAALEGATDLSPERVAELEAQVQAGDAARGAFIEANTRLVVSVAKKYRNYGLPFQDLIQAGNIGLIRAVDKFDYQLGNRFSTYATWWIRQSIRRALTQQGYNIRLPYYLRNRLRRVRDTSRKLEKQLGRRPTLEEIAEAMGDQSAAKLQQLLTISKHTVSLNIPVGEEGESELLNLIADEDAPSPVETVHSHLMSEDLEAVMNDVLDEREIGVLVRRFGLQGNERHTLQELADELSVSRERVRQIERKALRKLRHPYQRRKLRSYLR